MCILDDHHDHNLDYAAGGPPRVGPPWLYAFLETPHGNAFCVWLKLSEDSRRATLRTRENRKYLKVV